MPQVGSRSIAKVWEAEDDLHYEETVLSSPDELMVFVGPNSYRG